MFRRAREYRSQMPYHVSLTDSLDGGQRYRVTIVDALDGVTARNLGDWLAVASLNPAAGFELDLSRASDVDQRALGRMLERSAQLRDERRLEIVEGRPVPGATAYAAYAPALAPLLATLAA